MDKLREEIENMALEFAINDIAKKRLLKAVDALPSRKEILLRAFRKLTAGLKRERWFYERECEWLRDNEGW